MSSLAEDEACPPIQKHTRQYGPSDSIPSEKRQEKQREEAHPTTRFGGFADSLSKEGVRKAHQLMLEYVVLFLPLSRLYSMRARKQADSRNVVGTTTSTSYRRALA